MTLNFRRENGKGTFPVYALDGSEYGICEECARLRTDYLLNYFPTEKSSTFLEGGIVVVNICITLLVVALSILFAWLMYKPAGTSQHK